MTSAENIEETVTTPAESETPEVEETTEAPAAEATDTPAEETTEAPVAEATETPAEETAEATETAEAPASKPARVIPAGKPIQTVGRRKQAIVRVRLMPGTGKFTLNGRTLEEYFPNKVHQQLIREPFVTAREARASSTSSPPSSGGGITGQAGALRLGDRPRADRRRARRPPGPEEGRLPHP